MVVKLMVKMSDQYTITQCLIVPVYDNNTLVPFIRRLIRHDFACFSFLRLA